MLCHFVVNCLCFLMCFQEKKRKLYNISLVECVFGVGEMLGSDPEWIFYKKTCRVLKVLLEFSLNDTRPDACNAID